MTNRDEILSRLPRTNSIIGVVGSHLRAFPDLPALFTERLRAAKGEVHRVQDINQGFDRLREIFEHLQIQKVAANREPPLDSAHLVEVFPNQRWQFAGESQDFRSWCAEADAGLTSAVFALAETGSVVLVPGPTQSRLTSLLPPVHIVLLPESRILPSIFDWVGNRPETFPSNLVLVSGPSKTADIEQTLVVGVHGPKRLIVILYPDES